MSNFFNLKIVAISHFISRSGTLGYEAAQQMKDLNIGVSTSVGIGGDPINGSSFKSDLATSTKRRFLWLYSFNKAFTKEDFPEPRLP